MRVRWSTSQRLSAQGTTSRITPENDAGAQNREEARSGSTDTPAETWDRCAAMFPDRRHLRQQQLLEEELAWESYERQVAAGGTGENLLQRNGTSGSLMLASTPEPTHTCEPATIHNPETAPQLNPAITDAPGEDHGVPTPEDTTVAPPVAEEEKQDADDAEPEDKTEAGGDGEGTTGQESDGPATDEPKEEGEETDQVPEEGKGETVQETSEKVPQPAIEVTSDGGTLVLASGDPSDPTAHDGGETGPGDDGKGGEDGHGEPPDGDSSTPEGGESRPEPQRGDETATSIGRDNPVQVTGDDLQSIRDSAAYKDGTLVVDKDGNGVLLSPGDTKDIRDALDHLQDSLQNARDDMCGPDPDTKINPDGQDITGKGQQGVPITGDDLHAIRDAGERGDGVIIAGENGGLHLDPQDTKDINNALDHAREEIDAARPDDARQSVDGTVASDQDVKNANPPQDPYPIHDPGVADGQTKVTPEDLRDIRAAGRGDVNVDVVIETDGRKVVPHEDAEGINNACDRLQGELSPPTTDPGIDPPREDPDNQDIDPAIDREEFSGYTPESGQETGNESIDCEEFSGYTLESGQEACDETIDQEEISAKQDVSLLWVGEVFCLGAAIFVLISTFVLKIPQGSLWATLALCAWAPVVALCYALGMDQFPMPFLDIQTPDAVLVIGAWDGPLLVHVVMAGLCTAGALARAWERLEKPPPPRPPLGERSEFQRLKEELVSRRVYMRW